MGRRKYYLIAAAILGLFLCYTLWAAVQLHRSVTLMGGYRYCRTDSDIVIRLLDLGEAGEKRLVRIADRCQDRGVEFEGLPTVGPNVDAYAVTQRFIVGHVSNCKTTNEFGDPINLPQNPGPTGYFVIDVHDDEVYDGLSRKDWVAKLRALGIKREPRLHEPSIFDEMFGRNKPVDEPGD